VKARKRRLSALRSRGNKVQGHDTPSLNVLICAQKVKKTFSWQATFHVQPNIDHQPIWRWVLLTGRCGPVVCRCTRGYVSWMPMGSR
jgi:hypothetical protein